MKNLTPILIYGGTGQSKVIKPIIEQPGNYQIVKTIIDDTLLPHPPFDVANFYCGEKSYETFKELHPNYSEYKFVIAIGNPHGQVRRNLYKKLKSEGMEICNVKSPTSTISWTSPIPVGCQIHSGVIINPNVQISSYCIFNTGAIVEHDCILEEGVEIGPGATVCGEVKIGENTWVGAGATVLPHLNIGKNVIIGAGSVVTKDIPDGYVVVGNPAKFLKINKYE